MFAIPPDQHISSSASCLVFIIFGQFYPHLPHYLRGGWVWQRCCVSYALGCPTDIGLQYDKAYYPYMQVRVERNVFISSVSSLSLSFIFPTISSVSFVPFSGG